MIHANKDMKVKPVILTFVGNYLPGYKAGGILRSVVNTVDHLNDEFDFKIVTKDRDLGEDKPYQDIRQNRWQQVGNAQVYYLTPDLCAAKNLLKLMLETSHDLLFLNSFFDPFTVKILWNRRLGRGRYKPIIVAPRGEFAWASLKQKYPKKYMFIKAARLMGLYNDVTWHASSEYEAGDLANIMKIKRSQITIALDLPTKIENERSEINIDLHENNDEKSLKVMFLSRISREKNLDYALKVLSRVKNKISFDIYGPKENVDYWNECQELIDKMPENIKVRYMGEVYPLEVVDVFGRYDLFLFPSGGENYGHVIAESLTAGTPVLTSTDTPWRGLEGDGFGWDIDLSATGLFVEKIEYAVLQNREDRLKQRAYIKSVIKDRLLQPSVLDVNRRMFRDRIVR